MRVPTERDFPIDIWKKAASIVSFSYSDLNLQHLIRCDVATALLDERERCARICEGHIEVVASRGLRWLEPHERINEELHSGLTYAKAIRGDEGSIRA